MFEQRRLYAVLTGDVVKSSGLSAPSREQLLDIMQAAFASVESLFAPLESRFTVHRGDSFQAVVTDPVDALHAALLLRASLRRSSRGMRLSESLDAYVAVGIGTISFLPEGEGALGDGEAFRRSGPTLDAMKRELRGSTPSGSNRPEYAAPSPKDGERQLPATVLGGMKRERRLVIRTPWPDVDDELEVECALLDGIASKWSSEQSEVMAMRTDRVRSAAHCASCRAGCRRRCAGPRSRSAGRAQSPGFVAA